jgi:hypothetical protein
MAMALPSSDEISSIFINLIAATLFIFLPVGCDPPCADSTDQVRRVARRRF